MLGREKIGNSTVETAPFVNNQESGKKLLAVIPEGMTVEQYEAYLEELDRATDRFGNPRYSEETKQNLIKEYARGNAYAEENNGQEIAVQQKVEEKQEKVNETLAGRTAQEALSSIDTELKSLEWAKVSMEQFLMAHAQIDASPEEMDTYQRQLEMIATRTAELEEKKGLIEQELSGDTQPLPTMGERAAVETNWPTERDSSKLMAAMGRILKKWQTAKTAVEPEMLATEPGAQPRAEEFSDTQIEQDDNTIQERGGTIENHDNVIKNRDDKSSERDDAQVEQRERKEALKERLHSKLSVRGPWKKLATKLAIQAGVFVVGASLLFPVVAKAMGTEDGKAANNNQKKVEADANGQATSIEEAIDAVGANSGTVITVDGSVETDGDAAAQDEQVEEAEKSFEDQLLDRGTEMFEGFMNREGSEINDLGVMGNYSEGWDLNKPGQNHFGPDISYLVQEAIDNGQQPEDAIPAVVDRLLATYRDQPECLMSYIASFPNLLEQCGISSEITGIEDVCERTNALINLLYSEEGGGDMQKRLLAAAELTMRGEGAEVDLTQCYDYVKTDYLRLKPGETESGLGKFEIASDQKQRKGEWHLTAVYEYESATVNTTCGGQKSYIIMFEKNVNNNPTTVTVYIEANEDETVEEVIERAIQRIEEDETTEEEETEEEDDHEEEEDDGGDDEEGEDEEEEDDDEEEDEEEEDDDDDEEEDQPEDDSKNPEDAKIVLNDDEVTDGVLDVVDDVEEVEEVTDYEEVVPEEEAREEVVEEIVEDNPGDAEKQEEIDKQAEENNKDIVTDDEKADAIAEFIKQFEESGQ